MENDQGDPPCDLTDEPCHEKQVELLEENQLAFEIYEIANSGAIGQLGLELARELFPEMQNLNDDGKYDLLRKLRIISSAVMEIEAEEARQAASEAKSGRSRT